MLHFQNAFLSKSFQFYKSSFSKQLRLFAIPYISYLSLIDNWFRVQSRMNAYQYGKTENWQLVSLLMRRIFETSSKREVTF